MFKMGIIHLFRLNYDFIHSMGAEMSCEHNEQDGTRNDGVNTLNLKNDREQVLPPRRTTLKEFEIDRGRWMNRRH